MARYEKVSRKSKKSGAAAKASKTLGGMTVTKKNKTPKTKAASVKTYKAVSRDRKDGRLTTYVAAAVNPRKTAALLRAVKSGLGFSAFEELEASYQVTRGELAKALNIPLSTLKRRKDDGHLDVEESDRIVRYARLIAAANDMMAGNQAAASDWMKQPQSVFDGETPMERASTELGAREVEKLIGRIANGVFV